MPGGRPPLGPHLVDGLDGVPEDKTRLKTILETIAGTLPIAEACARLHVGEARFHVLRRRVLEAGLEALAPGVPGRPRQAGDVSEDRLRALERELDDLRVSLRAAEVRTEIALAMPRLLKDEEPSGKKIGTERGSRGGSRRSRRGRRGLGP